MEKYTLERIFELEPELKHIAERATSRKRLPARDRHRAYARAKTDAWPLIGWEARNPHLRSSEAWDCFFRGHILKELGI